MHIIVFKIAVLWIAVDTFLIATAWYLTTTVRLLWPGWWQRVVVDEAPPFAQL